MPTAPYFEDLFDSSDFWEWGNLLPVKPLIPIDWLIDEQYSESESRGPEGRLVNAQQDGGQVKRWEIALMDLTEDERYQIKRFHAKGVFKFTPSASNTFSVEWQEHISGEAIDSGGVYHFGMTLTEVT